MKKYILFAKVSIDSVYVRQLFFQPIDSFDSLDEAKYASKKIEIKAFQLWYGDLRIYSEETYIQENLGA